MGLGGISEDAGVASMVVAIAAHPGMAELRPQCALGVVGGLRSTRLQREYAEA